MLIEYIKMKERICEMDLDTISRMSPSSLSRLTCDFMDEHVRLLMYKCSTNEEQRRLLNQLKDAYEVVMKNNDITWGTWRKYYPDSLEGLEFDIECGRLITAPVGNNRGQVRKKKEKKTSQQETQLQSQLEESHQHIAALEAKVEEQEKEYRQMQEQISCEIERQKAEREEMIVELLKGIFHGDEEEVRTFLKTIAGKNDVEITDVVCEWVKKRRISQKSKGRPLWSVLHAAKLYQATETNWNTVLRTHP